MHIHQSNLSRSWYINSSPLDKIAAIMADGISKWFFLNGIRMVDFRFEFPWNLFPRVQLTISQHWFRLWLGAKQATSHYLNWRWPSPSMHICCTRRRWVKVCVAWLLMSANMTIDQFASLLEYIYALPMCTAGNANIFPWQEFITFSNTLKMYVKQIHRQWCHMFTATYRSDKPMHEMWLYYIFRKLLAYYANVSAFWVSGTLRLLLFSIEVYGNFSFTLWP